MLEKLYDMLTVIITGRTGRAGRSGKAVTFFTDTDGPYLKAYAPYLPSDVFCAPTSIRTVSLMSSYNPDNPSRNGSQTYRSHRK